MHWESRTFKITLDRNHQSLPQWLQTKPVGKYSCVNICKPIAHMHVCVCLCVCMWTHVYRHEKHLSYRSSDTIHLVFFRPGPSLAETMLNRLSCLASKTQGFPCLHLPNTRIQACTTMPSFLKQAPRNRTQILKPAWHAAAD